ncbi:MAG: fatty acid--CoA ligase [Pseudomonadota bacterium]
MASVHTDHAENAYAYPLLVKQLWHAPLAIAGDQEIVYRDRQRFTYRELRVRVSRLANLLTTLGVEAGDTVAVMDWDSHRYLEAFYAVPMMQAVLMTANIRLSPEQLLYTLNHSGSKVLLLNSDFAGVLAEIAPRLESLRRVVWISDDDVGYGATPLVAGEYEAMLANAAPDYDFPDFDENTRATTFYTTGTTGLPKGVFFSHRQLILHTLSAMAALASPAGGQRFHRGDVYMPITPMFHVHAWGLPYVALQLGVKQVYPGRYIPSQLLRLIASEGVTFSHCVPTILQMMLGDSSSSAVDLSRWKVVIGGSALPAGLVTEAAQRGIDVFGGYGMSETCPLLAIAQLHPVLGDVEGERETHFRCKAGAAVPLVELRTVDAEMRDVEGEGEVVARAPWLTQGYTRQPEASRELWRGGWLHTQDIGFKEDGYLKITDRIKDVIKTGGEWVSSLAVEDLISRHESVAEVAVIGMPDEKWGERPLALVVARDRANVEEAEIKRFVGTFADSGIISRYAVPSRVMVVESIARTSVGKLDKKLLRQQYGTATLGAVAP